MNAPINVARAIIQRMHEYAFERGKPTPNCFKVSTNNIASLYKSGRYVDDYQIMELCRAARSLGYIAFQTSNNIVCFIKDDVPNNWVRIGFGKEQENN